MWKPLFDFFWFMTNFLPARARARIRRDKLFDYGYKLAALRRITNARRIGMFKGGWNIGFIVDKKYVFKIRKFYQSHDARILREKRITDAFAQIVSVRIPEIKIIDAGEYTFYRYAFISGRNLNTFSEHKIRKNRDRFAGTIAKFIFQMHGVNPPEINDLRTDDGDGWNHADLCNNILVDPKRMRVVGIIDWENASFGPIETEFRNLTRFKKKIADSGLGDAVRAEYEKLVKH